MSIIGDRVKQRLAALKKSQSWLASEIGMGQQGVNAICDGVVKRPGKLREIAKALQTSQGYLLGETDDDSDPWALFAIWDEIPKDRRALALEVLKGFRSTV